MLKLSRLLFTIALSIVTLQPIHAAIAAPEQQVTGLLSFTLDKREAKKGETIMAHYQLNRPARNVSVTATNYDGAPLSVFFPQTATTNAKRNAGAISFTLPAEVGTLSPLLITLNIDGELRGLLRLIVKCDYAWFFSPRVERCPYEPVIASPAAIQRFEHGTMIWLQETDSIYVLYNAPSREMGNSGDESYQLERYDNQFVEGSPEPNLVIKPPEGKFQPIRGFGLVWRTTATARYHLGWALEPERGYTACYGYAFGGGKSIRSYVTTPDSKLLEFWTYYAPTRWRELSAIEGQPASITGCDQ